MGMRRGVLDATDDIKNGAGDDGVETDDDDNDADG
jgi:hypothetical protein